MTTQLDTTAPFWQVTAVFDPDGGGHDFAYTTGLAGRGHPELHIWAAPTDGEDPGGDWKFSSRDLCLLLNEFSRRLLRGELEIGDTWSEVFDDGAVRAVFTAAPAQNAESLEAYGAAGSDVMPIRWSLQRAPIGEAAPMDDDARRVAVDDLAWLREAARRIGVSLQVADEPDWSVDGAFGPRTPVASAYSRVIEALSGDCLDALIENLASLAAAGAESYPLVVARSTARGAGRVEQVQRAEELADRIGHGFGSAWASASHQDILRRFGAAAASDRTHLLKQLRCVLADCLRSFFATVVVSDHLTTEQRLAGLGPVMAALSPWGCAPTSQWWAPVPVRDSLRKVLTTTDPDRLVRAAAGVVQASFNAVDPGDSLLRARALSSAAMAPDVLGLMPPLKAAHLQFACSSSKVWWLHIQNWAGAFCAIATFGDEVPGQARQRFVAATREWIPEIERYL